MYIRKLTQERNHAVNVGKASFRRVTSLYINEFILERSPIGAKSMVKPSVTSHVLLHIKYFTLEILCMQ